MCDHCSKVTGQKGYGGQVTCKCEHGEKKLDEREKEKEKDFGGCCSKKAREAAGGCCQSGCCKDGKEKKDGGNKENGKGNRKSSNAAGAASPKSAGTRNGMTRGHEKAVVFAGSLPEKQRSDGTCCADWKKTCCGGGCCGSTDSSAPCCGIRQSAGMVRQTQSPQYRKSMYQPDTFSGPSGYTQSGQPDGALDYNCNPSYVASPTTASCRAGELTPGMGVCPAMMRNLPCTPIIEPKCFGGDCRDDDTDSEHSRQI